MTCEPTPEISKGRSVLAVLCPGQGSQSAGFLAPWLALPDVATAIGELSESAELDLARLGSDPGADVVDTAVAQPLVVAAGIVTARLLGRTPDASIVLGHSIGELTAAAVAGAIDDANAVRLAVARGRAMSDAAAAAPSGMTAVLGGDADDVIAHIDASGCWIANHNAAGQIVAGGDTAALDRLAADPPPGARLRRLPVAGAFHTPLMAPAVDPFDEALARADVANPRVALLGNADGAVVGTADDLRARLVTQLTAPVRFDRCLDTLRRLGVTATVELAPGGVLTGLVRRELADVHAVALRSPDELDEARAVVMSTATGDWSEPWRIVVAPANGTFRTAADGLGRVQVRDADVPVQAPVAGDVVEWLAEDGDPVSAGQPLARLLPQGAA